MMQIGVAFLALFVMAAALVIPAKLAFQALAFLWNLV